MKIKLFALSSMLWVMVIQGTQKTLHAPNMALFEGRCSLVLVYTP